MICTVIHTDEYAELRALVLVLGNARAQAAAADYLLTDLIKAV